MTLESHVVSRELCEKLVACGWKRETCFVWALAYTPDGHTFRECWLLERQGEEISNATVLPAPLASEMLEEMKEDVVSVHAVPSLNQWKAFAYNVGGNKMSTAPTAPDALAKLFIEVKGGRG